MNTSAERQAAGPTPPVQIQWAEWVELPPSIIRRFPELAEWDKRNRLRDEANRLKVSEALDKLQQGR